MFSNKITMIERYLTRIARSLCKRKAAFPLRGKSQLRFRFFYLTSLSAARKAINFNIRRVHNSLKDVKSFQFWLLTNCWQPINTFKIACLWWRHCVKLVFFNEEFSNRVLKGSYKSHQRAFRFKKFLEEDMTNLRQIKFGLFLKGLDI